jgi:hypothetical protein
MIKGYFVNIDIIDQLITNPNIIINNYDKHFKDYHVVFNTDGLINKLISSNEIIKCRPNNTQHESIFLNKFLTPGLTYDFKYISPDQDEEIIFDDRNKLNIYDDNNVEMYIIDDQIYKMLFIGKLTKRHNKIFVS